MQVAEVLYHVSSVRNRKSILINGLNWRLMGAVPGIAGSYAPEVDGCFLCLDESDTAWFAEVINSTGGPVDVWEIQGVNSADLVESAHGYFYFPRPIPASRLRLHRPGA